jgi:homogentisate 1,2-dioxygenase
MPYYRSVGEVPRKRHTQFPKPEGGLYAEELIGIEGFSQESALLYHRHLPTAIVAAETLPDPRQLEPLLANDPLLPRHFRTDALPVGGDAVSAGRSWSATTT